MPTTGRRSYTTVETTTYNGSNRRISAPRDLPEPVKRAFVDLVSRCPEAQFEASDIGLIRRWAELTVMAETAAAKLAAAGMVTADGRISPWFTIHQQTTKSLNGLCLRLRLSPQARQPRAPKTRVMDLSVYQEMNLERANGDDEAEAEGAVTSPQ
jgi:hypothetical protein